MNTKSKKNPFHLLILLGLILVVLYSTPAYARELRDLNFTIPINRSSSQNLTLSGVPGKTLVSVSGRLNALPFGFLNVPVRVELTKPEGGSPIVVATGTALPLISLPLVPTPEGLVPQGSDFGCPRSWRVTVRTENNQAPPVAVSGSITISFFAPGEFPNPLPATYNIDMEGSSINLGGGASTTPVLAGHDPLLGGISNRSLIQGTEGVFNIRAKWDTALNVCYLGQIFPLTVELRRSTLTGGTGTVANSQNGFSQTSGAANKINFQFTVPPGDALLPGPWRLRVINNNNPVNCGIFGQSQVAIENFDIENLLLPTFASTFTPRCSEALGSGDLAPAEAETGINQRLNYAFTWTVPEGLSWHHLETLQLTLRDEEGTAISILFREADNTISVANQATGNFGNGFAPGSPNRLQTSLATLSLADTRVTADGPASPTVTLNLALSFKPQAAGRTFNVEIGATDKDTPGSLPGFLEQVGTLTVASLR